VYSGIAEAVEERSMTALIMLDYSAVFYRADYPILLNRLEVSFDLKEKTLN